MNRVTSATVAILLGLGFLFLSACGNSSSPGAPAGGGTGPAFGSLALSGTGTTVTGTTYNALSRLAISNAGQTITQWYDIDLAAGVSYPYIVLVVMRDNAGAVTSVSISRMISSGVASDQWTTTTAPSASNASATTTEVTFTNMVVPGYAAASTTTSLTLNGVLRF